MHKWINNLAQAIVNIMNVIFFLCDRYWLLDGSETTLQKCKVVSGWIFEEKLQIFFLP